MPGGLLSAFGWAGKADVRNVTTQLQDSLEGYRQRLEHIATRLAEQGELLSDLQDGSTIDTLLATCTQHELKLLARHLFQDLVARHHAAHAHPAASLSRHSSRTSLHNQPQTPMRVPTGPVEHGIVTLADSDAGAMHLCHTLLKETAPFIAIVSHCDTSIYTASESMLGT